jgi:hypothetical protein
VSLGPVADVWCRSLPRSATTVLCDCDLGQRRLSCLDMSQGLAGRCPRQTRRVCTSPASRTSVGTLGAMRKPARTSCCCSFAVSPYEIRCANVPSAVRLAIGFIRLLREPALTRVTLVDHAEVSLAACPGLGCIAFLFASSWRPVVNLGMIAQACHWHCHVNRSTVGHGESSREPVQEQYRSIWL